MTNKEKIILTIGSEGKNVIVLHDIILKYIKEKRFQYDLELLDSFREEQEREFFGKVTHLFLQRISEVVGYNYNNEVDLDFFTQIDSNNSVEATQKPLVINGIVQNQNGLNVANIEIYLFKIGISFEERTQIGNSTSNEKGEFNFEFNKNEVFNDTFKSVDLCFEVKSNINEKSFFTNIFHNILDSFNVNISVPEEYLDGLISSFEQVRNNLKRIFTEEELNRFRAVDISYIATKVNENIDTISAYILSKEYSSKTEIEQEFFYAILKLKKLSSLEVINLLSREEIINTLKLAISANIISHDFLNRIEEFADRLFLSAANRLIQSEEDPISKDILNSVMNSEETPLFLEYFFKNNEKSDVFSFDKISEAIPSIDEQRFSIIQENLKFAHLSGGNPAILPDLIQTPNFELVDLTSTEWENKVQSAAQLQNFVFPEEINDFPANQRVSEYAKVLKSNIDSAFPELTLSKQLINDVSDSFPTLKSTLPSLVNDNSFNLLKTSIIDLEDENAFPLPSISDRGLFIDELATVQRLNAISPSFEVSNILKTENLTSASKIASMGSVELEKVFAKEIYSDVVPLDLRKSLTDSLINDATLIHAASLLVSQDFISLSDRFQFITSTENANPEWRTLFPNSLDLCCCNHCQSVFSPSAYLVDSMEFLRKTSNGVLAYGRFSSNRSDIPSIELSCKNTNTPILYIDIVNEILEDLVVASKSGITPNIVAKNTTLDEKTLNAIPEYVNSASANNPYKTLDEAVFPWNTPYNFFYHQMERYLDIENVKPYQILQATSNTNSAHKLNTIQLASSYLGITPNKLTVLLRSSDAATNLYELYGMKKAGSNYTVRDPLNKNNSITSNGSNLHTILNRVDVFLQQSSFDCVKDIMMLLDCYYINPVISTQGGNVTRQMKIDGNPIDTCDLDKMTISGLDMKALYRIQNFVRLSIILEWDLYTLDKAYSALGILHSTVITESHIIALAQMKYIAELLKTKVEETFIFYSNGFNDDLYRKYSNDNPELIPTEYEKILRNPEILQALTDRTTATPTVVASYPFPVRKNAFVNSTTLFSEEEKVYLMGALGISESEYATYVSTVKNADTGGFFTTNISKNISSVAALHVGKQLSKKLKLKSDEYKNLVEIIGTPFGVDFLNNGFLTKMIDFIFNVQIIKSSGLKLEEATSIFIDKIENGAEIDKLKNRVVKNLENLRLLVAKNAEPILGSDGKVATDKLTTKLSSVFSPEETNLIVNLVGSKNPSSNNDGIPDADKDKFTTLVNTSALSQEDKTKLLNLTLKTGANAILDVNNRLTIIDAVLNPFIQNNVIIKYFEKLFKLPASLVENYLNSDNLLHSGSVCKPIEVYCSQEFRSHVEFSVDEVFSVSNYELTKMYMPIYRLEKLSILANKLKLSFEEILQIRKIAKLNGSQIPDIYNLNIRSIELNNPSGNISLNAMLQFFVWMQTRKAFLGAKIDLFSMVTYTHQFDAPLPQKQEFYDQLKKSLSLSDEVMTQLIGVSNSNAATNRGMLGLDFSKNMNPHLDVYTYLRVVRAVELSKLLSISLIKLNDIKDALLNPNTQSQADKIVLTLRGKYSPNQWLEIVKPINDVLRIARRDAMVSYLCQNPPAIYSKWTSSNDIFESLWIDTQMMPIVKTSRIRQAIASLQTFYSRCILQREKDLNGQVITLNADLVAQWEMWRKYYRVWEANRKVFIFPENWIEPELRDDKSPFFKDLEKYLKQNELTEDNIRDAYETYLEKLEEVANLEIVCTYTYKGVDHVWGRTHSNPNIFYYRNRKNDVWSAWEKMNIEIDSNHFCAIKHNGRLKFYWLNFEEKEVEKSAKLELNSQSSSLKYWDVKLSFSEFKNGKWLTPKLSKEKLSSTIIGWSDSYDTLRYFFKNKTPNSWFVQRPPLTGNIDTVRADFENFKSSTIVTIEVVNNSIIIELSASTVYWIGLTSILDKLTSKNFGVNSNISDEELRNNMIECYEEVKKEYIKRNHGYRNNIGRFEIQGKKVVAISYRSSTGYGEFIHYYFKKPNYLFYSDDFFAINKIDQIVENFDTKGTVGIYNKLNNDISYTSTSPNAIYNWELFFHIPMLIAGKLAKDQKFKEALQWYHFVFDPTDNTRKTGQTNGNIERFWKFAPFYTDAQNGAPTIEAILKAPDLSARVREWAVNPFKPHLVARSRYGAYMKNVVMKYLDTLISWGDMLFRRDTMESINEAIILYILAAQILGKSPACCTPKRVSTGNRKYIDFVNNPADVDAFSNLMTRVESILAPTGVLSSYNQPEFIIQRDWSIVVADQSPISVDQWVNTGVVKLNASSSINAGIGRELIPIRNNDFVSSNFVVDRIVPETQIATFNASALPIEELSKFSSFVPASQQPLFKFGKDVSNLSKIVKYGNLQDIILKDVKVVNPIKYKTVPNPAFIKINYFCIPQNEKLLGYWPLIADRLFKIRNSQSIEGVERQLSLFAPPIDPALLVRAAANGLSLSEAISDMFAPLPSYRFNVIQQKAVELAQEVKSLGQSLLSALEKKDAETLALLRSSKEMELLEMVKDLRAIQVKEAQYQYASLEQQQKLTTLRRDYYNTLITGGLNAGESSQLDSMKLSIPLKVSAQAFHALGGILSGIPNLKIGPFSSGVEVGGATIGPPLRAAGDVLNILATINDIEGSMAGIQGGHARREQEWKQQLKSTNIELKQMDKQLLASEIRVEMAQYEFNNHLKQIENAKAIDEAMRDKFTNEDLYDWMVGEISNTYFQTYKLAHDVAKRAERCYHFELSEDPAQAPKFIEFGYWDSLNKGLLSGEKLLFDIKRMDISFMDKNKRLHELTKHVSLMNLNPAAISTLKKDGKVEIELPEWLFDMDYPGHYMRRIKSVSISIPCVAGPYTTVAAKLTLTSNKIRKSSLTTDALEYKEQVDSQFMTSFMGGQSIATSSAQNDSGMFELNFRDERYLPFEGAGAISIWTLEIEKDMAQFDVQSIADVILHINYTAKYDGGLKQKAKDAMMEIINNEANDKFLPRVFELKNEFASEWNAYLQDLENGVANPRLKIKLNHGHFPIFCKKFNIVLSHAQAAYQLKDTNGSDLKINLKSSTLLASSKSLSLGFNDKYSAIESLTSDLIISKIQSEEDATMPIELELVMNPTSTPAELKSNLDKLRNLNLLLVYKLEM